MPIEHILFHETKYVNYVQYIGWVSAKRIFISQIVRDMRMNWTMSCHDKLHACTGSGGWGATRVIILCLEIWPACMHATSRCGDVIIRDRCSINSMLSIWYNNSSTDACLTFSPPHFPPNSPSISYSIFLSLSALSPSLSFSGGPAGWRLFLKCQIYLASFFPGSCPILLLLHLTAVFCPCMQVDDMTSTPPLFVTLRHPTGHASSRVYFFSRRRRGHPLPSTPHIIITLASE